MNTAIKERVPLAFGQLFADWVLSRLSSYAVRMEVAGSIRREKKDVGDVEILYIPRLARRLMEAARYGMGDATSPVDLVDLGIRRMMRIGLLAKRLSIRNMPIGYGAMNKMLVHVGTGIGIDIFSTAEANWGMAMVVRTGPAEWNKAMMSAFRRLGFQAHAYGGVDLNGEAINCPTEKLIFELLGIDYIEPRDRATSKALARLRKLGM